MLIGNQTEELIQRIGALFETDAQFTAALPSREVSAAMLDAAGALPAVMQAAVSGYTQRPALAELATTVEVDPATDRRHRRLLPSFRSVSYSDPWDDVTALARAWTGGAVRPGDPVAPSARYEAPSPVQARHVAADTEHYGQTVAGSVVLLLNGAATRDERRYPDRFDIRRRATHLSFGHGLHFCLGASLARMEGRVALEEVLKRWPDWQVDYPGAERAYTASVRGWARPPVVV